jgi:shikimate kinase
MPQTPPLGEVGVRHVVLVGLMGSGKSTIGRRLAGIMNVPFVDTDVSVEETTGRSIRAIFEQDGEEAFRDLESRVLADAMATPSRCIVASGGGVVLRERNRRLLEGHDVIWLRADPKLLATRIGRQAKRAEGHRPLADDDPFGKLSAMSSERRSLYESVSTNVIDVDDRSPDEIVNACLLAIGGDSR